MEGESSRRGLSSRAVRRRSAYSQGSGSASAGGSRNNNPFQQQTGSTHVAASASRFNPQENAALESFIQQQQANVVENSIPAPPRNETPITPSSQPLGPSSSNPQGGRSVAVPPPDSILLFGTRIPVTNRHFHGSSYAYDELAIQPRQGPPPTSGFPSGTIGNALERFLWERDVENTVGFPSLSPIIQEGLHSYREYIVRSSTRNILEHMYRMGDAFMDTNLIITLEDDDEDEYEEMPYEVNVDQMSYEEILALQEQVGSVRTGLTHEEIAARLVRRKRGKLRKRQREEENCCICLDEYGNEQDVGVLDCGHYFHADCIAEWLLQKNNCPICKSTGLAQA